MSTEVEPAPSFRRAVVLMTATSFLVPAAGVVTAPVLARALDVAGRGELSAALAPATLMLAVATLGLPDALTYHVAKHPEITRPAVLWAGLATAVLGALCTLAVWAALPFLSAGDRGLGELILLATVLTVPALVVGVFRGAATGRQMWGAVALERLINSSLRVVLLGGLWLLGELTVFVAVLVSTVTPLVTGLAYWRLLARAPTGDSAPPPGRRTARTLLSFGGRVWLGSVASMLLARFGFLFMAPLSSVEDLGLYTVAATVSDLPLVVALAIQGTLYGVDSRSRDAGRLTATSRVTLLVGLLGCVVLGATLPLWIGPLFGGEFTAATVPTIMLLGSALICIPGLMAAAGVAAWGRPGLRSAGLAVALVVSTSTFVLLVPVLGVYGACWSSIATNVVLTGFMVTAASRVLGVRATDFLVPRAADAWRAGTEVARLARRLRPRRQSVGDAPSTTRPGES